MTNIRSNLQYLRQLSIRLLAVLLVFSLIRIVFYFYNQTLFPIQDKLEVLSILFYGLRFDLSSVIYINFLFILSSIIPITGRQKPLYQRFQKILFLLFNGIALIFELIDIGFYQFSFRRTIGSDLNLFRNTSEMIPGFLAEYWWLIVFYVLLLSSLYFVFKKTESLVKPIDASKKLQYLFLFLTIIVFGMGLRGGIQLRPITSITAFQYTDDSRLAPLMSNTNLNLIHSVQFQFVKAKNYFSEDQAKQIFLPERQYSTGGSMDKKNVFIIVLESFGTERIGKDTPFLDSLLQQSFRLEDSYANGLRSTQGIVAITSSVPSLMDTPLMFSAYQSNRLDGLAKLLGAEGYQTTFFHGANPGSMEFERFSKLTGFQEYLDRSDYPDDNDYDGQWGIWDDPFFQYSLTEVNQYSKPFCALLFSLTSHHPYKTPEAFTQKYPDEDPLLRSMRYTDEALQHFFETAKKMQWFDNTLFVILADHTGQSSNPEYQTRHGLYKIPIAIYDPKQEIVGMYSGISQQLDIMPTILDALNYNKPFKAYGQSMLDSTRNNLLFNYANGVFQIQDEQYFLLFDGNKIISYYDFRKDPLLLNNLMKEGAKDKVEYLERKLKAIVQRHHTDMIENTLFLNRED